MKALLNLVAVIFTTLALAPAVGAKAWRGIVPLRSTRADVERLLGKSPTGDDKYEFENERVTVNYPTYTCSNGGHWNVTPDTVTGIVVAPKGRLKLSDLPVNLKEYEWSPFPGVPIWSHRKEGIMYRLAREGSDEVEAIYYVPTFDDEVRHLCPGVRPCFRYPHICPRADIYGKPDPCAGTRHGFSAGIGGVDPDDSFTFTWSLSAGQITEGQGTMGITVDTSSAGGKAITVKFEAISRLCEACNITATYTIEPCPKDGPAQGGERKPPASTRP